jgi:6-phosphofructokinase
VLNSSVVDNIQLQGGTILGTSRGGADLREIVKRIDMWGIDMLFVVGGNGGNAGANAIQQMCAKVRTPSSPCISVSSWGLRARDVLQRPGLFAIGMCVQCSWYTEMRLNACNSEHIDQTWLRFLEGERVRVQVFWCCLLSLVFLARSINRE